MAFSSVMESSDSLREVLARQRDGAPPWALFTHRLYRPEQARRHLPFVPFAAGDRPSALFAILDEHGARGADRGQSIYIHVPFCESRCAYCGYNCQRLDDSAAADRFVEVVVGQVEACAATAWARRGAIEALYFGGGTPTVLSDAALAALLDAVRTHFTLDAGCEITVEACPRHASAERVAALRAMGVNRVSLGVQSFDYEVRRTVGRSSKRHQVLDTIQNALAAGLDDLCIDLLFNLPRQSEDTWREDLATMLSSGVAGCSIYPLIVFPGTPLAADLTAGRIPPLGDVEQEYRLHMATEDLVVPAEGWTVFSPVHFGQPGRERGRYLTNRARSGDILGLGPGAAGSIGGAIYLTTPGLKGYLVGGVKGGVSLALAARLPDRFLELSPVYALSEGAGRLERGWLAQLPTLARCVDQLVELGLAGAEDREVHLTPLGRFWAANVSSLFSQRIGLLLANLR